MNENETPKHDETINAELTRLAEHLGKLTTDATQAKAAYDTALAAWLERPEIATLSDAKRNTEAAKNEHRAAIYDRLTQLYNETQIDKLDVPFFTYKRAADLGIDPKQLSDVAAWLIDNMKAVAVSLLAKHLKTKLTDLLSVLGKNHKDGELMNGWENMPHVEFTYTPKATINNSKIEGC